MTHFHVRIQRGPFIIDEYVIPPGDDLHITMPAAAIPCSRPSCPVGSSFALRRCWG